MTRDPIAGNEDHKGEGDDQVAIEGFQVTQFLPLLMMMTLDGHRL